MINQKLIFICVFCFLVACQSDKPFPINNLQLVYYAVDFKSFTKEFPELKSVDRRSLIIRLKSLEDDKISELVRSKFTLPYLVMAPAFLGEGGDEDEDLATAIEVLNFLESKGMDIYKTDNGGCTSIHMAISFGEPAILEFLLGRYDIETFKGNDASPIPRCRKDASELLADKKKEVNI